MWGLSWPCRDLFTPCGSGVHSVEVVVVNWWWARGQTRLVDSQSPLCCPIWSHEELSAHLVSEWAPEIKRSHFDRNIVPDNCGGKWPFSRSDGGWLVRWSLSAILLGLMGWVVTVPMLYETVRSLLHGFGASGGSGWCPTWLGHRSYS